MTAGRCKKNILFLYPYRFTEFDYYKYEIAKLEKKYNLKVIIHDLSNIINNKKLNSEWKTKLEKKTIKFYSLMSWISYFNRIKKKKIIILNYIDTSNFSSFIINLLVRLSKLPVLFYEEADPRPKPKKNIYFFLSRIKEHIFNYKVYLFYLKQLPFTFIIKFFKYDKIFLLSRNHNKKNYREASCKEKKNFININMNTYDFSNALTVRKNKKKKLNKNYIIYLDNGGPYFTGDTHEKGNRLPNYDVKKWYRDLDKFFDKIEHYYNAKVVIIPHPKYKSPNVKKIKSLNPYFSNRIVNNDYDSLAKLSPNCLFFINQGSTALSYAITHHKPAIHIYSSQRLYARNELRSILGQSENTGKKPIDISTANKKKIMRNLTVDKSRYKYYKYKYLTQKNKTIERIPNYKIIGGLANR